MQTGFPIPLDNDSEDVAWGLTTGAALWKQGERHDAIIWLKRAVLAATEAGQSGRADELNRAATNLIAALASPSAATMRPNDGAGKGASAAAPLHQSTSPPRAFGRSIPAPRFPSKPPNLPSADAFRVELLDDVELLDPDSEPPPSFSPDFELTGLEKLGELTEAQRDQLLESAVLVTLSAEDELKVSGLVLMLEGQVTVQPTVTDVPACVLSAGEVVYEQPSIHDVLSLRLVAEGEGTRLLHWDRHLVEEAFADAPEWLPLLQRASDRVHAMVGSVMGSLGERLDEGLRAVATERLEVRVLQAGEVLAEAGQPVPGLVIVGVGSIELEHNGAGDERLGPGDFLFPAEVLGGSRAPHTARAGSKGAIVLFGARALTHELLVSCPPLLEIFAGM